jgi:hypothetical protein
VTGYKGAACGHGGHRRQAGLELDGRPIVEGGVQSLAVVDLLDEAADRLPRVVGIAVGAAVDLLLLQRLHEALRLSVVVGIADAAHAWLDGMAGQQLGVVAAGVLHAAVGVVDEAVGRRPACRDRHGQRGDREARLQVRLERPADDPAAVRIEHHDKIGELPSP